MNNTPDQDKQAVLLQHFSRSFMDAPFNQILGLTLDYISAEHITLSFNMKHDLIGNFLYGILHGGVISSVLDMAGGFAVMAAEICKHPNANLAQIVDIIGKCSTIDLHISFLSPGKGERFIVKAWLTKSGKSIAFAQMELRNEEEKLIATGAGTYILR